MEEKGMIWYILALLGLIFVYVWVSKLEKKVEEKVLFKASFKEDKITFLEGETDVKFNRRGVLEDDIASPFYYYLFNEEYPTAVYFYVGKYDFEDVKDYDVIVEGSEHKLFYRDKYFFILEFKEGAEATIRVVDKREK